MAGKPRASHEHMKAVWVARAEKARKALERANDMVAKHDHSLKYGHKKT